MDKNKLKRVPGLVALVRLCRLLGNSGYRSVWRLKRNRPDNLFQPYPTTQHNRYPRIFAFVRERLSNVADLRLLSYGCSTGEEVFTLREYFPVAEIVGIDINPHNIAVCRKRLGRRSGDNHIRFEQAGSPEAEQDSSYDAVFCMAVLRHGDLGVGNAEFCTHLIRFSDFERTVTDLCRCLKPGGYLVIRHSNFRFADIAVASEFDNVLSFEAGTNGNTTPIYGSDNRLLANYVYNDVVFRKR
ncbi:MAG: class I SAM-dependent methyltransferase [Methylobacter sp.]